MRSGHDYEEIRNGVRTLCAQFPDAYFRKIDAGRGYPSEFVAAAMPARATVRCTS
jgi:acyl-CoA dehydrogenase